MKKFIDEWGTFIILLIVGIWIVWAMNQTLDIVKTNTKDLWLNKLDITSYTNFRTSNDPYPHHLYCYKYEEYKGEYPSSCMNPFGWKNK